MDILERHDDAKRIRDGTIDTIACPHCGEEGTVDGPLLVYPERQRLLRSPPPGTSREEGKQTAGYLLGLLAGTLRNELPDHLNQTLVIPRETLLALQDEEDLKVAVDEAEQQSLAAVERERLNVHRQSAGHY